MHSNSFYREMQTMKELVCTICESVTNLHVELTIKRNSSKSINHNLNQKYQTNKEDNEHTPEKDYIKSCQVIKNRLHLTLFAMIFKYVNGNKNS